MPTIHDDIKNDADNIHGCLCDHCRIRSETFSLLLTLAPTMNSERYCDIINNKVIPHFTAGHHEQWIYQHDGAPSHFSVNARKLLDGSLPGRWYGRRVAVEWPPRSPDLTAVCESVTSGCGPTYRPTYVYAAKFTTHLDEYF